jgi:hypothetical protein
MVNLTESAFVTLFDELFYHLLIIELSHNLQVLFELVKKIGVPCTIILT